MRAIAIAALALAASCTVDRRSQQLACTTQAQCNPLGRICVQGYCVASGSSTDGGFDGLGGCPPGCLFCDPEQMTCMIQGLTGGDVTCPSGWNCTIACESPGACGAIACDQAASCNITCSFGTSCGDITCGAGDCTVSCSSGGLGMPACGTLTCGSGMCTETCQGDGACGDLACDSSCACSATCNPSTACATMTCPTRGNKYCAQGGSTGAACDPGDAPQCSTCP
ncbi:MAG TPA: hypothetical protein VLX92_05035 [Kofleriaceae bacterium]|nr:hypothetical protein [Kofleriaceae bacterium]